MTNIFINLYKKFLNKIQKKPQKNSETYLDSKNTPNRYFKAANGSLVRKICNYNYYIDELGTIEISPRCSIWDTPTPYTLVKEVSEEYYKANCKTDKFENIVKHFPCSRTRQILRIYNKGELDND